MPSHLAFRKVIALVISCISRWVLDIFKLGMAKDLETEDLYETLDEHRSEFLGNKLEG
jgi:hypothetical protein